MAYIFVWFKQYFGAVPFQLRKPSSSSRSYTKITDVEVTSEDSPINIRLLKEEFLGKRIENVWSTRAFPYKKGKGDLTISFRMDTTSFNQNLMVKSLPLLPDEINLTGLSNGRRLTTLVSGGKIAFTEVPKKAQSRYLKIYLAMRTSYQFGHGAGIQITGTLKQDDVVLFSYAGSPEPNEMTIMVEYADYFLYVAANTSPIIEFEVTGGGVFVASTAEMSIYELVKQPTPA